jgi:enterochelin esterase-like enzyme
MPYNPQFQYTPAIDSNFDFALPARDNNRGTITTVNYTSRSSIHPASDVHEFGLYLPKGYDNTIGKQWLIMYLSHGAVSNGEGCENQGTMAHIMDNLVRLGHIEPTVVVMPSFSNIDARYPFITGSASRSFIPMWPTIRENYQAYLFPNVDASLAVLCNPVHHDFAGLSSGGGLTYEMDVNAADYFSYCGMFSQAAPAGHLSQTVQTKPQLLQKGVFNGYALYDSTFT